VSTVQSTEPSTPAFTVATRAPEGIVLAASAAKRLAKLVEAAEDDDLRIQADGQTALIDPVSVPFLKNSEIAYVDELAGAQFVVRNPNAASSCGCGVSFSI